MERIDEGTPRCAAGPENALLDSLGVAVAKLLLDGELTLLWANGRFYHDAGYSPEEYQARFPGLRGCYEQCPADFEKLRSTLVRTLESGGREVLATVRFPLQMGGFRWSKVSATFTGEAVDGSPVFYAVVTDVEDLVREKEEATGQYEEKLGYFKWLMDEYVGNIYISDMENYELFYVNRTACDTLGRRPEEVQGHKCYEVIQGRSTPCPFCTNDRLTAGSFYEWEFFNPVLDRTFMIKNRIVNWNGRRSRIELSHDMYSTEYKLAKKDREKETLLKSIPGGFARVDARDFSTVLWYGADFLDLIGYTAEEFEKGRHSQWTYIHPDDVARITAILHDIKAIGGNVVTEARVVTRSGEVKILTMTLCYASAEESWDGIPSFYSVGIDVTKDREEQARQRKALEDAYQTARVANSAKTNFLSTMSHDIRTPMNAIMGMTSIAQANLNSPDRVHDCLDKIKVSSSHLLSLINEVLDMSKIESGKIDLAPENVDISQLIGNVADMSKPLIEEKHQDLQIHVGQVRHEKVVADGDRLQQVFMNLVSNAVKYTPDGGKIVLTINELPSMMPDRGRYEFVFADNGIGMSQEFIPHIFEPFSRAEDSRISKVQGTGLGMAITENIIHMMNGTIAVKSELGRGSEFTVSVPLLLQAEEEKYEEELAGLPVLVVDDDRTVCENAVMLLNELRMRGYWVLSGREAVERVKSAREQADDFFAVILDWKMPDMDGLQTLTAIREQLGDDVPIIIISAYDYSEIEDAFVRAGADAFITKPLFKSKMLHVLRLFCANRHMGSGDAQEGDDSAGLAGKRLLLAEDNELNREIAVELLQMRGLQVETAENGKEAVSLFQKAEPGYYAAVLMDIQMPVMDGYEATAAIRSLDREDAKEIPILALTANAFVSDVGKAQSYGMNDHVSKPIDMERLMGALQKWVCHREDLSGE